MKLNLEATPVFEKTWDALQSGHRYILQQGGTRSSKTTSILQAIICQCIITKGLKVSIVRNSFPTLRGTSMRDFFDLLNEYNLYDESSHNKTENYYKFSNGAVVEFFSLDSEQKVRGRKRDILFMNEGNEVSHEIYLQLAFRTSKTIIIDFNPSDMDHWIYDLMKDNKSLLIKSTYKDNKFLGQEQIDEIEKLIETDENYYRIYALGEKPSNSIRIYSHFKTFQESNSATEYFYGLDFGYNDPNVLLKCWYQDESVYVEEMLYKNKLTAVDLTNELLPLNIGKDPIYADYARPEVIEELRRAGFNVKEANKQLKAGIDTLKSTKIYVKDSSTNTLKESRLYSWRSKNDIVLDEPIDRDNHCMDALRYAIHTHKKKSFNENLVRFF